MLIAILLAAFGSIKAEETVGAVAGTETEISSALPKQPIILSTKQTAKYGSLQRSYKRNLQPLSNSITISTLPAFNLLMYSKISNLQKYGTANGFGKDNFDLGFGLTYRHQFSNNLQLAIGVNYRKYYGSIDYNGFKDSVHLTTYDELLGPQNYYLCQIFNSREEQSVTYIEPNVRLEYVLALHSAIDFIGGIGVSLGINIAESNIMKSGSYNRYANFYENHNLIEDLPSMNLGTYSDFINPLPGKTFKYSLFALGEAGFRFKLSRRWHILTMLNVQYSLLNIQKKQDVFTHHESYSGIAASKIPSGVHALSLSLEVGISCSFGFASGGARKPQRKFSDKGAHCPY